MNTPSENPTPELRVVEGGVVRADAHNVGTPTYDTLLARVTELELTENEPEEVRTARACLIDAATAVVARLPAPLDVESWGVIAATLGEETAEALRSLDLAHDRWVDAQLGAVECTVSAPVEWFGGADPDPISLRGVA